MPSYTHNVPMPAPLQELYDQLSKAIELENGGIDISIPQCEKIIGIIKSTIQLVRKYLHANPFTTKESEITFFKFIKPNFYSRFIYFVKVFKTESRRPNGSFQSEISYFMKELDKIQQFFEGNLDFYQYYRSGATFMDEKYFLRSGKGTNILLDSTCLDADPSFTTSHDYLVAKIIAVDMFRSHHNREIAKINNKETGIQHEKPKSKLKWTDSKTALIELCYAQKYTGSFNNGNASVKQIIEDYEERFDIKIGNYTKVLQNILAREAGYTSYIRKLDTSLTKYLESIL